MKHKRLTFVSCIVLLLVTGNMTLFAQGGTLAPNDSGSGSLSDVTTYNWWQITTTQDGALSVTTNSSSESFEIDLYLYTEDQTTQIAVYNIGWGQIENVTHNSIGPGTYWVKAVRWSGTGTYSITSQFTPTSYDTDAEPNDESTGAALLATNGSDTGHLYHYYEDAYDTVDWWKVTVPSDGHLIVTTVSDTTLEVDLSMYDVDGESYIKGYDISWGTRERTQLEYLMPGTYYIKAYRWSGYGAYTITSEFIPTSLENDTEDNDSTSVAQALPYNGSDTGHLGFRSIDKNDIYDYWAVTVPVDGSLTVTTVSDSTLEIDLSMFDDDGETYIAGYDIGWGITETTHYNGLTPGTYYVKAYRHSGYGSYTITSEFTPTTLSNDMEPNNTVETAAGTTNQVARSGHLGHYNSGTTDADDFFVITVPVEWDTLYVHSTSDSTLELDMVLYGAGGVSLIASGSRYGIDEWVTKANPAETTYYVKMHRWSGWGAYSFIVSNTTAARPDGTPVAVEESETPAAFALDAPFPNPFNPATTLSFTIPEPGHTRLTVYDILGRQIAVLVDDYLSAGAHSIAWHARDGYGESVGAGMYLFRLESGSFVDTRKALLVR